ncbi:RodZ domain-containing protein [Pseudoteredinibacter isoporae]|uniref:RodZ domain-containing protein n=1 Tax=Pseudoteredinibacter isoporae TaxID=570281 RepID=UPI003104706A
MSELDTNNNNEAPGPGAIISYAREQLGISSTDLAAELKITKHKLILIEGNEFEQVGTPTFVRGYLRNAARVLQLDVDMLLAEYDAFASDVTQFDVEDESEAHSEKGRSFKAIWALPMLLLFGLVWWLAQDGEERQKANIATSSASTTADQKSTVRKPAIETTAQAEEGAFEGTAASSEDRVEQSDSAASNESVQTNIEGSEIDTPANVSVSAQETLENTAPLNEPATETAVTRSNGGSLLDEERAETVESEKIEGEKVLLFRFKDSCWLQVRDATGKRLYSNTKEAGQQLRLQGVAPFRVNLGNVRAVELDVDGEAYPLEARSGRKTLAITIP